MKLLLLFAFAYAAPGMILLLAGVGGTWLYLLPAALAVTAAIVNARPPSRTP